MDGFDIKGTWINKNTGNKVIIRDAIVGETGMQIITNTGDLLDIDDFSKNYMQASNEIYNENGEQIDVQEVTGDDLGVEIKSDYKNDLFAVFGEEKNEDTDLKEIVDKYEIKESPQKDKKQKISGNYDIIKKFFDKFDTQIDIDLTLSWTDIPKEGLKTLIDYLDVKKEEISDYVYDNYLNKEKIKEILNNKISDLLNE